MINENYFETIDTNEKAYWLGFLYADGYIGKRNEKLQICLSVKDESHLDKFITCIGSELSCKRYFGPYKTSGKQVHWYTRNRKIVNDLIKLGCENKKSHTIRFPKLNSHDFNCAFLLGYYDGDGSATHGHCAITCGNIKFFEDIKQIFNMENIIYKTINSKYETYRLCLNRKLFESLLPHYKNSLETKRKIYDGIKSKEEYMLDLKSCDKKYNPKYNERKFHVTREELEKLLNEHPMTHIAKMFNVSDRAISKRAKILGIEFKNSRRGYWTKINKAKTS